ncbi:hypothetical protein EZV62_025494 [Acer yangbiense]|uniref:MIF4G domain-containing protein n=1 Tax=Acer yangbiense TaxID=1000413 RepID=A0A5C7GYL1_9ROSI|nr:hypothetical protein EZV62_025494 [Acer yangbiense]
MVITLLETCGHYFDRRSSKRKLDRFLIRFQRYILSKGVLPLDVEFDLQQKIVIYLNENAYATLMKIGVRGTEENGGVHEDSDSDSGSDTIDPEGHDEEGLDEENHYGGDNEDDDYDEGGGPPSDEDDEFCFRQKLAEVEPEEVANFDLELRAVVQESMEQHKQELRGQPALNMMIPINVFEGSSKDHHGRMAVESGDETLDEDIGEGKEVQSTKQKEAAELEEKQDIKRLVLEYNDREEDSNGLGTQTLDSHWIPSGSGRVASRGSSWEGPGRRTTKNSSYHPAPQLRAMPSSRGLLITLTLDDLARILGSSLDAGIRTSGLEGLEGTNLDALLQRLPGYEGCLFYALADAAGRVHKGKYGQIHLLASLTAGLNRYHDEFAVAVVDEVLEEIRLGVELNDYGMQQRRIAHMLSSNGQSGVRGTEENGGVREDSDSDSGSDTIDPEGHDEEGLDEENHYGSDNEDNDYDEGGGPASDEDDEFRFRQKLAEVEPEEVANVDLELRAVVQESMEQHKQELRGQPALNMMIPINVFEGSSKDHHGRMAVESGDETLDEDIGEGKEVRVKVLVKHGNKQQTKQMYIPRDCSLVQSTKQKEAAELEEKQDIKRLVLEYNDREEDSNELGTQDTQFSLDPKSKWQSCQPCFEPCLLARGLLITLTLDDLARGLEGLEGTNLDALLQRLPGYEGCLFYALADAAGRYIRKLLFSDLDMSSIEHVLRQLRKLPWSDCESYLLKCFMKVHKGKYGQIHLLASLTAGLSRYHDEFAVAVVDEVLEEIRLGVELNDYGMQQRRIAHMPEQDVLDPPEDCFHIRMVITLLETCGHYFDRGSFKRKLDRFLIPFQRYILSKGVLPLDVEFDLQDDDYHEGGGPASDEDDEFRFRQKLAEVEPEEVANLDLELRAVVQKSMEQHKQELRGQPALNMMIPINVFEGSSKDHHGRMAVESGDETLDEDIGEGKEVRVKVLVKRENKQQTKQMYIPRDCSLMQSTKQKEAAELEEKQDIKRLVLEYNDREEDSNGLGTQTLDSHWIPSGSGRVASHGSSWEGPGQRTSGSHHGHLHYPGSGVYHSRRK